MDVDEAPREAGRDRDLGREQLHRPRVQLLLGAGEVTRYGAWI